MKNKLTLSPRSVLCLLVPFFAAYTNAAVLAEILVLDYNHSLLLFGCLVIALSFFAASGETSRRCRSWLGSPYIPGGMRLI